MIDGLLLKTCMCARIGTMEIIEQLFPRWIVGLVILRVERFLNQIIYTS